MTSQGRLLIAGGGTGGHIFPGIAIAEEWQKRGGEVLFVGTPRGQESKLVPGNGFKLELIRVGSLKGGSFVSRLKTIFTLPFSLLSAMRVVLKFKPDVVLGIGGYASGPTLVAAKLLCKKTAITDQNSHPGMTNRLLGKIVRRVFVSFEPARSFFPAHKVIYTGNPVRAQIQPTPYQAPTLQKFRIFIFGGSQGAVAVNENVMAALDQLQSIRSHFEIVHQAGKTDIETVRKFYQERHINARVEPFITDMNTEYSKAHVVICRSGAGTLTELALSGRPSILIPYPFAADDHQTANARVFVDAGAAWMFAQKELSGEKLAALLQDLFSHPDKLSQCAKQALTLAKPRAAQDIVDGLLDL